MSSVRFPGESDEYRAARDALLEAELDLRRQVESVATQRRALPLGGEVPTDYDFLWPLWAILDRTPQGAGAGWMPRLDYD